MSIAFDVCSEAFMWSVLTFGEFNPTIVMAKVCTSVYVRIINDLTLQSFQIRYRVDLINCLHSAHDQPMYSERGIYADETLG